jgi:hypothetical protein
MTDKYPTWLATITLTYKKSNLVLGSSLKLHLDAPWIHEDLMTTYTVGVPTVVIYNQAYSPSSSDEDFFTLTICPPKSVIQGGFDATLFLTGSETTLSPSAMPTFLTYSYNTMNLNSTSISIWFFVVLTFVSLCAYRVFRTHRLNQMVTRRERGDDEHDDHITMSPIVTAVYPPVPPQAEVHVVRITSATSVARVGSSSHNSPTPANSTHAGSNTSAAAVVVTAEEGQSAEAASAEAREFPPIATAIATPVPSPRRL